MKEEDEDHVIACPLLEGSPAIFSDDVVTDHCCTCGELVRHRPHTADTIVAAGITPKYVCLPCLVKKFGSIPALLSNVKCGVTPETAAEVKQTYGIEAEQMLDVLRAGYKKLN